MTTFDLIEENPVILNVTRNSEQIGTITQLSDTQFKVKGSYFEITCSCIEYAKACFDETYPTQSRMTVKQNQIQLNL